MTHPASLFCIPALILSFLSPMTAYLFFLHFLAGAALASVAWMVVLLYVADREMKRYQIAMNGCEHATDDKDSEQN